jgi:Predicted aminoglycoside phosphotransferase
MRRFFRLEDGLDGIIKEAFENETVLSSRQIVTGWTNIVIEVETDSGEYFFRFPRNDFWAKMIVKDQKFCRFIEGKTSFYTPSMRLLYDGKRPFSVHKKIKGYSLADRIYNLSHTAVAGAAHDIGKFIKELSAVDVASAPEEVKVPLSDFLEELSLKHFDNHIVEDHKYIKDSEEKPCFVHGDLNLGNVLLDENDKVTGVIDFCFAGVSNVNMDVARIVNRPTPEPFEETLVKAAGTENPDQVRKMREIWKRIDAGYVGHMKKKFPEITLPEEM